MRRRTATPPQAAPESTGSADRAAARPSRRAVITAAAVITVTAALLLVWAAAAEASVWVVPAMARVKPATAAPLHPVTTISLDAAQNEYQGVQVCVRGGDRQVRFSWSADSSPLIADPANTGLFRVYYVKVTTPTTSLGSRPGWYPDPLVPRDFGTAMTVPGSRNPGPTTPFYVLVHVPPDTPAGDYQAKLEVENGAEQAEIPVTLHVWDFGWQQISARSAFCANGNAVRDYMRPVIDWNREKDRVMGPFWTMMRQHGLSPSLLGVPRGVTAAGHFNAGAYAATLEPYLGAGGLDISDTQMPWLRWTPWREGTYSPTAAKLTAYLDTLTRMYKDHGWQDKAYTYILDETNTTSEERRAEAYARALHRASAKAGYRARFLLTDDPRPHSLGGAMKHANAFLFDDIDVWATRYYYYFGRIPAVRDIQRTRKNVQIWWYTYANGAVSRTPSYVIDKPHIDSRAWGWLMEEWHIDGLLNWGFNRWGKATTGNGWRDPYRDPLSLIKGKTRSNGDTCLVYPGYYPRYGLTDPYAPPVSSLRLEALRDGLEEREYLELAKTLPGGQAVVDQALATVTTFPYKIRQANVFDFPKYTHSNGVFDAAREKVAQFIEAAQAQQ